MRYLLSGKNDGVTTVKLERGKVNALNEDVVDELRELFEKLAEDNETRAVILTGTGKFFTFGFDIPEFIKYPREGFFRYLTKFTDFYNSLFIYQKPVIAALNGHTIAGGCMISMACDYRLMITGKARISLNEINFGSSLFAGSVEIAKRWLGQNNAEMLIYTGAMYSAEEAQQIGLINEVVTDAELASRADAVARMYAAKDAVAFASIKRLLRKPIVDEIRKREKESLHEFVDIWYSESTWRQLQDKVIYA